MTRSHHSRRGVRTPRCQSQNTHGHHRRCTKLTADIEAFDLVARFTDDAHDEDFMPRCHVIEVRTTPRRYTVSAGAMSKEDFGVLCGREVGSEDFGVLCGSEVGSEDFGVVCGSTVGSEDFDVLCGSEVGSEWTVVTSAETAWPLGWEGVAADGSEWASDETIARALQQEEREGLVDFSRFVMKVPTMRQGSSEARADTKLLPVDVEELAARLGVCVICSESVATVVMEPCGHLALCGLCSETWSTHAHTCVICRTPGTDIHLLRAEAPTDVLYGGSHGGVVLRLSDGAVSIPSLEPESGPEATQPAPKLRLRQQQRALSRQARSTLREGDKRARGLRAGGRFETRAREDEERQTWITYAAIVAQWKARRLLLKQALEQGDDASVLSVLAQVSSAPQHLRRSVSGARMAILRELRRPRPDVLRPTAHWSGVRRGYHEFHHNYVKYRSPSVHGATSHALDKGSVALKKRELREHAALEAQERHEKRLARTEQAAHALAAAQEVAAAAADLAQSPAGCVLCGSAACMLALPCRHMALCRPCWDAGERQGEVCAQCGSGCKVVFSLYRP